jgi:N-acetylglutamate synthase-like GNAT family acetyltransferase
VTVRPYVAADGQAVDALLDAAYAGDPVLREISAVHSEERGTLLADEGSEVVGVATLVDSARHPTRLFLAGAVHPARRRRRIATALLRQLREHADRPLIARVRRLEEPGGRFLCAHGFGLLMRNVTVVVDPRGAGDWIDVHRGEVSVPASLEELAAAHERAYRRQHASWAPATERPLEESLRLFCGASRLDSAFLSGGVASLHGEPFAERPDELALIAGADDEVTARVLVAHALDRARAEGKLLSIEADEQDAPFWRIAHELPAVRSAGLVLLSTDVTPPPVAT